MVSFVKMGEATWVRRLLSWSCSVFLRLILDITITSNPTVEIRSVVQLGEYAGHVRFLGPNWTSESFQALDIERTTSI